MQILGCFSLGLSPCRFCGDSDLQAGGLRSDGGGYDDFTHLPDELFGDPRMWKISPGSFRLVSRCETGTPFLAPHRESGGAVALLPVHFAGSGFIYNQIRHMVGMIVAVTRGFLPPSSIPAALSMPRCPPLPLAPAGGLVLRGADWAASTNISQDLPSWQKEDEAPVLSTEEVWHHLETGGAPGRAPRLALLLPAHAQAARDFFSQHILPDLAAFAASAAETPAFAQYIPKRAAAVSALRAARSLGPDQCDAARVEHAEVLQSPMMRGIAHSAGGWLATMAHVYSGPAAAARSAALSRRWDLWSTAWRPLHRQAELAAVLRRQRALLRLLPARRLLNAELFARGLGVFMTPTTSRPISEELSGTAPSFAGGKADLLSDLPWDSLVQDERDELQLQAQSDAEAVFEGLPPQAALRSVSDLLAADPQQTAQTPLLRRGMPGEVLQEAVDAMPAASPRKPRNLIDWEAVPAQERLKHSGVEGALSPLVRITAAGQAFLPRVSGALVTRRFTAPLPFTSPVSARPRSASGLR